MTDKKPTPAQLAETRQHTFMRAMRAYGLFLDVITPDRPEIDARMARALMAILEAYRRRGFFLMASYVGDLESLAFELCYGPEKSPAAIADPLDRASPTGNIGEIAGGGDGR